MTHQTVSYFDQLLECDAAPEPDPECPVEFTLAALRGRWTPQVLNEFLRRRQLGFSDLATALPGISAKVLTERLDQLVEADVLSRQRVASWPPRVTYTLTARGEELGPVVRTLWDWGHRR